MVDSIDEHSGSYWPMFQDVRARLLGLFGQNKPALLISGHVHQWRDRIATVRNA